MQVALYMTPCWETERTKVGRPYHRYKRRCKYCEAAVYTVADSAAAIVVVFFADWFPVVGSLFSEVRSRLERDK
jgi:hypothetical protein